TDHQLTWTLPDISLSDDVETPAWRPNSFIQISCEELPFVFDTTSAITMSPSTIDVEVLENIVRLSLGSIIPPDSITVSGIRVKSFSSALSNGELDLSYDGYWNGDPDSCTYSYVSPDELTISDPSFGFSENGYFLDQVIISNANMYLDSCVFVDPTGAEQLFVDHDIVTFLIPSLAVWEKTWDQWSASDSLSKLMIEADTTGAFIPKLYLNGHEIRESQQSVIVSDIGISTSDADLINSEYHIYLSQSDSSRAAALITDLPTIQIDQGSHSGLINSVNDTLYIKLPESDVFTWADQSGLSWNWEIDTQNIQTLKLSGDWNPNSIEIEGLKVNVREGYLNPEAIEFSVIPPRRTGNSLYFHEIDATGKITVIDLAGSIQIHGDSTHIDSSLFVFGDPQCDSLELKLTNSNDMPVSSIFSVSSVWTVDAISSNLTIEDIEISSMDGSRIPISIGVGQVRGDYSGIDLLIPTPYQGIDSLKVDWSYIVVQPSIGLGGNQFITANDSSDYHWLDPIYIRGDEFGTLGHQRSEIRIKLPEGSNFEFLENYGAVQTSRPDLIAPIWEVNNTFDELVFHISEDSILTGDHSIEISSIPIRLTQSISGVPDGFKLEYGLSHGLYNPVKHDAIHGVFSDDFSEFFGYINVEANILGSPQGDTLKYIMNSTDPFTIEELNVAWNLGSNITIDSISLVLPQSLEEVFANTSTNMITFPVTSDTSLSVNDVVIGEGDGNNNYFGRRGNFKIPLILNTSSGSPILTDGLSMRIAAPTFIIPELQSMPHSHVRLQNQPLLINSLQIIDDDEYGIFSKASGGDADSIYLHWGESFSWVIRDSIWSEEASVDTTNPDVWLLIITDSIASVITIEGVDLIPVRTFKGRQENPWITLKNANIKLLDDFTVAKPAVVPVDTSINAQYDKIPVLSGIVFSEDQSASISDALHENILKFKFVEEDSVRWLPDENMSWQIAPSDPQSLLVAIPELEAGDSLVVLDSAKIDHRASVGMPPYRLSIEVSLPELEQKGIPAVIDTIYLPMEYPDIPAEPVFTQEGFVIPLFENQRISTAYITNVDTSDFIVLDVADFHQENTGYTGSMAGTDVTIQYPGAATVQFNDGVNRWISQQFINNGELFVIGDIQTTSFRSEAPFNIRINPHPFEFTGNYNFSSVRSGWPAGETLSHIQSIDSVLWRVYVANDSSTVTIDSSEQAIGKLSIPQISEQAENGVIYYVEYSSVDSLGPKVTLPLLIDDITPTVVHRYPIVGDSSPEVGKQPHPISSSEVMTLVGFDNVQKLPLSLQGILYWDSLNQKQPDTLTLLDGITHANWQNPLALRTYHLSESDSVSLTGTISKDSLSSSSSYDSIEFGDGNIVVQDSLDIIWDVDVKIPEHLKVVTRLTDMAGNAYVDTLIYPLVVPEGSPIHDKFFNYPNPFNARAGENTNFSFLIEKSSSEVSMIILKRLNDWITSLAEYLMVPYLNSVF
ncbi:MAG: hypothetical protein HN757_16425, partial [Calditrichaeota bacterium]|nr:hypothetical protein [Calditrichota bacterium]